MNRIEWVENLRVIATIAVIILHVAGPGVASVGAIDMNDWNIVNIFDSSVRFCVPVFVMITGTFLLNKDYEIKDFLTNKALKIIVPFLFFSFVYIVYNYGLNRIYSLDLKEFPQFALNSLISGSSYHLWYIYMLIGLYLMTPILRVYTKNATKDNLRYYLILWFAFSTLASYSLNIYLPNFQIPLFLNYTGFYILGYYLSKFNTITPKQGLLLYLTGTALTIGGTWYYAARQNIFNEMFYGYLSLNVIMQSVGIYAMVYKSQIDNSLLKKAVALISVHSFNIYLVHVLVLNEMHTITWNYINPLAGILLRSTVCLLISLLISIILKKIPGVNKLL